MCPVRMIGSFSILLRVPGPGRLLSLCCHLHFVALGSSPDQKSVFMLDATAHETMESLVRDVAGKLNVSYDYGMSLKLAGADVVMSSVQR